MNFTISSVSFRNASTFQNLSSPLTKKSFCKKSTTYFSTSLTAKKSKKQTYPLELTSKRTIEKENTQNLFK